MIRIKRLQSCCRIRLWWAVVVPRDSLSRVVGNCFLLEAALSLLLLLSGNPANSLAQSQVAEPKVTVAVDRTEVQVADPFQVTLTLVVSRGTKVNFPEVPAALGSFDILEHVDRFDVPQRVNPDQRSWVRKLTLETIETGQIEIPSFEVAISRQGKGSQTLRTAPVTMKVASVVEKAADLGKFQDIADLYDVEPLSTPSLTWVWWWVGGGTTLALVACGVIVFATRSRRGFNPARWALQQLDHLAEEDFPQLETVLRTFIGEQFEFPAETYPSASILEMLQSRGVPEDCLADLDEVFEKLERIRFGGLLVQSSEAGQLLTRARELIQQLAQITEGN